MDNYPNNFPNTQAQLQCDAQPLDWALLILMVITTHVTWWAMHLPTLWREGFGPFLHDVAWECTRIHLPSFVGVISVHAHERQHWHTNYYQGVMGKMTNAGVTKVFLKDSLVLVTSILSIYRLCTALQSKSSDADLSGLNSSLWNYPSLPTALIGICISIAVKTSLRPSYTFVFTTVVIAIAGTAIVLATHFSDSQQTNVWIGILVTYLIMALPFSLIAPRSILPVITVTLAAFARVGGPVAGALSPDAYFPYCALKGPAFGAPLLAMGILAGLLALYGFIRCRPRIRPEPVGEASDDRVGYGQMDDSVKRTRKWEGELRPIPYISRA
ncbi:hypothetical protein BV22DRAFT_569737 [Leucogyrophana mollusca]|uniref:Uncharacterized protein n=1 Tax=Leucogyrophana mollusca TaxID=85980 RepID=A0ACB8BFK0_9AGAM|nr:hypothetical protein BV22DRAFT_569737 [Leucogyrophana mollusca]